MTCLQFRRGVPLPSNRHHRRNRDCLEGKREIIRSVLCSIVCNNCAQYIAHTWTDLTVVCWLDLPLLWLYCVLQFVFVRFSFFSTMRRHWLRRTSLKWPILCRVGRKTLTQACLLLLPWKGVAKQLKVKDARAPTPDLDQTGPHICKFGAAFAINLLVRAAVTLRVLFIWIYRCGTCDIDWLLVHPLFTTRIAANDRSVITYHSDITC